MNTKSSYPDLDAAVAQIVAEHPMPLSREHYRALLGVAYARGVGAGIDQAAQIADAAFDRAMAKPQSGSAPPTASSR